MSADKNYYYTFNENELEFQIGLTELHAGLLVFDSYICVCTHNDTAIIHQLPPLTPSLNLHIRNVRGLHTDIWILGIPINFSRLSCIYDYNWLFGISTER